MLKCSTQLQTNSVHPLKGAEDVQKDARGHVAPGLDITERQKGLPVALEACLL